jgi:hypothetical protein
MFGREAYEESRISQKIGGALGGSKRPGLGRKLVQRPAQANWFKRVAKKAEAVGLPTNYGAVRDMKEVMDAPVTKAAVERGEIPTIAEAVRRARTEKTGRSKRIEGVSSSNLTKRLALILEYVSSIAGETISPAYGLSERLAQLEEITGGPWPKIRAALVKQGMIRGPQ